jgi:tetratricopeptide (TPR) repeat protein
MFAPKTKIYFIKQLIMKNLLCILALFALVSVQVQAQNYNSKVTSGVMDEQSQRYEDAIEKLELALEHQDVLKPKNLAKAKFALHRAYSQVALDTAKRAQYPDALFRATQLLEEAMADPNLPKSISATFKQADPRDNLWGMHYNEGVTIFNQGDYKTSLRHFEAAQKLKGEHFLTQRMLGSNYLIEEDTSSCVGALEKSLQIFENVYEKSETAEISKALPDYERDKGQLSYIYQQLAVIYQAQGDTRKALDILTTASEMLPDDQSVKRQELAIYQQNPSLLKEAEAKFKSAMEKEPDDINIKLAYAALLSKAEKEDEAAVIYAQTYEMDPNNLQANYGLGAHYINQAAQLSQEKGRMNNDEEIKAMDEKIVALIEKAYPHMVWLHEAQPEEEEWLLQLSTITPILGKDDESMEWMTKLTELKKKKAGGE